MTRSFCFVLMPFGKKPDAAGVVIDFDAVYKDLIAPAIEGAGLQPIRADEEQIGGIIHKPVTKEKPGIAGKGREVIGTGTDGSYELREPSASYKTIYEHENDDLRLENLHFWSDTI